MLGKPVELSDTEEKLAKHRSVFLFVILKCRSLILSEVLRKFIFVYVFVCVSAQLCKDQALLEQLHQQELRKREALKLAEGKVVRLKEQLLAAEKVASANRVLLRKLQEQACARAHTHAHTVS